MPAPFAFDAVIKEEDTFLVLSAEPTVEVPEDPPGALLSAAVDFVPPRPGSVVIREGHPVELLAVVHDLDADPTWREEWVARALSLALGEVDERGLTTVALPMLGAIHGSLDPIRFLDLLARTLDGACPRNIRNVWLRVPAHATARVYERVWALGWEVEI